MFNIKNACKNIKRNQKRYVIVAILVFIISFISIIAFIVDYSSETTVDYYMNKYGSEATIDIDPEQLRASFNPEDNKQNDDEKEVFALTYDDYQEIAQSQYVNSVSYEMGVNLYNENLQTTSDNEEENNQPPGFEKERQMEEGSFQFIGSDELSESDYFSDEANVLIDGELASDNNQIVISNDLATNNDKQVGDTISFDNSAGDASYTMEIVGIYESVSQNQMMNMASDVIYTTYSTLEAMSEDRSNITAKYELTSYTVVDQFEQELYDNGLDEMYYVNNNQNLLEQVIGPVNSTMNLLNNVMVLVFLIGGAILIFINLLILRERKYEIGVRRALGEKKSSIIRGLAYEACIVGLVAMIAAVIFGNIASGPIANNLLASTIEAESGQVLEEGFEPGANKRNGGGNAMGNNVEEVSSIDTELSSKALFMTLAINLLLMLTTTIAAARFITRQEPNEILRER